MERNVFALERIGISLSAGTNMKIIYANRLTDEVKRKEGKKTTTTLIPFKLLSKMMEKFNLLVKLD